MEFGAGGGFTPQGASSGLQPKRALLGAFSLSGACSRPPARARAVPGVSPSEQTGAGQAVRSSAFRRGLAPRRSPTRGYSGANSRRAAEGAGKLHQGSAARARGRQRGQDFRDAPLAAARPPRPPGHVTEAEGRGRLARSLASRWALRLCAACGVWRRSLGRSPLRAAAATMPQDGGGGRAEGGGARRGGRGQ